MQEISLENRDFTTEIVRAIESGVNKHLNKSIKYSPFKLAFNLFKNANPKIMYQVRLMVRDDLSNSFLNISDYKPEIFMQNSEFTAKGQQMLKISYNIGIHLLRDQLNVKTAFKALYNHNVRLQIYDYVLEATYRSARRIIHNKN